MKGLLFVATPKSIVSRKNNSICVINDSGEHLFPIGSVEHVFLFGGVHITTPAIRYINSMNKYIFLLNSFGKINAIILPEFIPSDYSTRLSQYNVLNNENAKINLTKMLLKEKAKNIGYILGYHESAYNRSIYIKSLISNINFSNLEEALGIDGSLNSKMFQFMRENFLPDGFEFSQRDYHPPKDPINAVLSLTYSIYYSILVSVSISYGFDPYLGFFHTKRGRHASFCSDLIEISRPFLTLFVFELFKEEFFEISDFTIYENGCFLKEKALRAYLKIFSQKVIHGEYLDYSEKFLKSLRDALNEISNNL